MLTKSSKSLLLILSIIFAGCDQKASDKVSGLDFTATPQEIDLSLRKLADISDGNIPKDMDGALILDVTNPQKLYRDKKGLQVYAVKPDHIYSGADQIKTELIALKSPLLNKGGIDLVAGKRYRILTLKTFEKNSDAYYIWQGSVLDLADLDKFKTQPLPTS